MLRQSTTITPAQRFNISESFITLDLDLESFPLLSHGPGGSHVPRIVINNK